MAVVDGPPTTGLAPGYFPLHRLALLAARSAQGSSVLYPGTVSLLGHPHFLFLTLSGTIRLHPRNVPAFIARSRGLETYSHCALGPKSTGDAETFGPLGPLSPPEEASSHSLSRICRLWLAPSCPRGYASATANGPFR